MEKIFEEYFQAFHNYAVENGLPANTRLIYYTLLLEMFETPTHNRFSIAMYQLKEHSGIQSNNIIQKAVTQLRDLGILKIESANSSNLTYSLSSPNEWR